MKSKFKFLFGFNPLEQKASHKHTIIKNDLDGPKNEIIHTKSEHTMNMQKSKYIAVEHDHTKVAKFVNE